MHIQLLDDLSQPSINAAVLLAPLPDQPHRLLTQLTQTAGACVNAGGSLAGAARPQCAFRTPYGDALRLTTIPPIEVE